MIDDAGGIQCPLPDTFNDVAADNEYPFVLLTGRGTVSQSNTQTRTGKSGVQPAYKACAVSATPL